MSDNQNGPESGQDAASGPETPVHGSGGLPEEIARNFHVVAMGLGVESAEETFKPPLDLDASLQVISRELGLLSRNSNLFRQGSNFLTVDPRNGETRTMDTPRLCSWVEEVAWPFKWTAKTRKFSRLGKDLAALVLAADWFRDQVREIKGVRVVRLPVWRGQALLNTYLKETEKRTTELLPAGFDEPSGIYTIDGLPFDHDWPTADAGIWLAETLKDYPWADPRSMSAHVAAMLSPFIRLLLPAGAKRTMIVYNGNHPGTGKSTLARMALYPVYGDAVAHGVDRNPDELRKILDTAALERKPYLFIDDMGDIRSKELNAFVTSNSWSARVLGHSRTEEAPIEAQVVITGNQLDIGAELERRALVVDLFLASDSMSRRFELQISDEWLMGNEVRSKFLAFLWSVVRHWRDSGFQIAEDAYRPSFEAYSKFVGSILSAGGFEGPFAPRECKMGGDDEGAAIQALLRAAAGKVDDSETENYKPDDLLAIATELELLDIIVRSAKNPRQSLGHKLRKWQGRELVDDHGRPFRFGKYENNRGAVYPLTILPTMKRPAVNPQAPLV